jgi:hypothetical protein
MPAELFRREALEYSSRQHGPGAVLRVGAPWLRWLVRLQVDGPTGRQEVAASVRDARAAEDADVRQAGFSSFPQPAVLVTGVLDPDTPALTGMPPRLTGRAVVLLGSTRVAALFFQGFEGGNG